MVAGLAIASQFLYSFYMQLFNNGAITYFQTILLDTITLLAVSTITVFVGWKSISYLKSISKKPIKIFGKIKI
jgi:hypothetical protein